MKFLFLAILFLVPIWAKAADRLPFELGVSPNFTARPIHNSFEIGVFLKIPLSESWQLKLTDDSIINVAGAHQLAAGADYNFSADWASSFFAGGGVGYHMRRPREAAAAIGAWFGYVEAGKRISLVHSLGLSYAPQVQLNYVDGGEVDVKVMPANFTWMF